MSEAFVRTTIRRQDQAMRECGPGEAWVTPTPVTVNHALSVNPAKGDFVEVRGNPRLLGTVVQVRHDINPIDMSQLIEIVLE